MLVTQKKYNELKAERDQLKEDIRNIQRSLGYIGVNYGYRPFLDQLRTPEEIQYLMDDLIFDLILEGIESRKDDTVDLQSLIDDSLQFRRENDE